MRQINGQAIGHGGWVAVNFTDCTHSTVVELVRRPLIPLGAAMLWSRADSAAISASGRNSPFLGHGEFVRS